MGEDVFGDPELEALGRRFRDELRAEAEEDERLAARDLLRSRDLAAVALELLHRGDVVGVVAGRRAFVGEVVYAARDLACVRTASLEVDVALGGHVALRVAERVRAGGQPRGRGPGSFLARLREHEQSGVAVELHLGPLGLDLRGVLTAVAADHVAFDAHDGQRWFVARSAISAVVRERRSGG